MNFCAGILAQRLRLPSPTTREVPRLDTSDGLPCSQPESKDVTRISKGGTTIGLVTWVQCSLVKFSEALEPSKMSDRNHDQPIDPRVRIGHVHLKVADLERALRFYPTNGFVG